jgi:dipeptidyl aminopeptidase/acylaminoacyl peptidase
LVKPIPAEYVYDLVTVATPSLSPDGTRVAFVRGTVDTDEKASRSTIMIADLPGTTPRPFTQGPADSAPKFSPDGDSIAFLRADESGTKQIWIIALGGGDPRQLTRGTEAAVDHAWSPDSRSLAFVSRVDPDAMPADGDPKHDHKRDPRGRVARRIRYRHDEHGWLGDAFNQLFTVNGETGETRQLTDGAGDCAVPIWSPASDRIAFVCDEVEDRDISNNAEVRVIDTTGKRDPRTWSEGLFRIWALSWSAHGTQLAALGTDDALMWDPREASLFILEPGKPCRNLTNGSYTSDPLAQEVRWAADGRIYFIGDRRGESFLCQVEPVDGALTARVGGGLKYTAWSLDDAAQNAAMVEVTTAAIDNVIHVDLSTGARTQLTAYNEPYLEEHPPATMEKFKVHQGGQEIECRVLLPPGFDASRRYPMILDIHGGPNSRFYDWYDPYQQIIATAGYVVLGVNCRGTSSYGLDFAKMVLGDWGGEDYRDIMAGVDEMCSRDYIDADRIGLHGSSYGGYMGSWIIGHETRFKAAIVGAPVSNLHSFYGTSDIGVSFAEMNWGGTTIELRDALLKHSPLTYVDNVTTPVFLYHGENDQRCPIEQSEQYFVALKRQGKVVDFVRFPGCSHGFRKLGHPKLRVECSQRILDWLAKYV